MYQSVNAFKSPSHSIYRCETCRYASSRVASVYGLSIRALCLNPESPCFHDMMSSHQSCPNWMENSQGAVDLISGNPYDPERCEP